MGVTWPSDQSDKTPQALLADLLRNLYDSDDHWST